MGRPRHPRPKADRGDSAVGQRLEVSCGPIAHGGFTVARADTGRVVFVRHALPGERVVAVVTEGSEGERFWRADAVEIIEAAAARVVAPCQYAGPGGCGGCDFQHVEPGFQRELKAAVVHEQLARLAGLDWPVTVEEVPGGALGWRTRVDYLALPGRRHGLRAHRSHRVVEIERCLIAAPEAQPGVGRDLRPLVAGRAFDVPDEGFWQPHRAAPEVLGAAVLDFAEVRAGDRVVDLYSGVGLFSALLAPGVGLGGHLWAVEGDARAGRLAVANLADLPQVTAVTADVARWLADQNTPDHADVVVADPPRAGAKARVVEGICALTPRTIVHVACDPAALARDVSLYAAGGYELRDLRAFDLFPMTHHVECVALLAKAASDPR